MAAGKLKLTDTIGALLPDYPNAEAKPATVEQLLGFHVGVADFFGPDFEKADKNRFQSNHDYYAFVAPRPLTFAPGVRTEYCNGCFIVLGEIVARVSGLPYERYIQERVFAPAGMKTAGFLAYGDPEVAPAYTRPSPSAPWASADTAHGHRGSAAGGSYGTVRDLLAFDNAIRTHALLDAKMTAWFFDNPADADSPACHGSLRHRRRRAGRQLLAGVERRVDRGHARQPRPAKCRSRRHRDRRGVVRKSIGLHCRGTAAAPLLACAGSDERGDDARRRFDCARC